LKNVDNWFETYQNLPTLRCFISEQIHGKPALNWPMTINEFACCYEQVNIKMVIHCTMKCDLNSHKHAFSIRIILEIDLWWMR